MNSIDSLESEELEADWLQNQQKKAWHSRIRRLQLELQSERLNRKTQQLERKAESLPTSERSPSLRGGTKTWEHSAADTPLPQSPMTPPEEQKTWDLSAVNKSRLILRRGSVRQQS